MWWKKSVNFVLGPSFRGVWSLFCICVHSAYLMDDVSFLSFLLMSFLPFTSADHYGHMPSFGSASVFIGPAQDDSSAKFIRRGFKGGINFSKTCRNCVSSFVMYGGWNMPIGVVSWQMFADFIIAMALFSIPVQVFIFVKRTKRFPYRLLLLQFCTFITMCGLSHFLIMFSYGGLPRVLLLSITVTKLLAALVSCTCALMAYHQIPDLLSLHERSIAIKAKTEELTKESTKMLEAYEVSSQLRLIGQRIRSSMERGVIVSSALLELRDMLALNNVCLWLPSSDSHSPSLELSHECEPRAVPMLRMIPLSDPIAAQVLNLRAATIIPGNCHLAECSVRVGPGGSIGWVSEGGAAAVAVPLLDPSDPNKREGIDYGILVMVLPVEGGRKFRQEVLLMVDTIVEQMALALLHSSMLEISRKAHEALLEEEEGLKQALLEGKSAVKARDSFLQVMNAKMRTPMHSITALSSLLAESELNDEQRSMAETVAFSSTLLASLLYDILEFWRLEEDNMKLKIQPEQFELPALVTEAETLSSPIAKDKGLMVTFKADPQLPESVVGDGNRLLQVLLNVVNNSIKYTHSGTISVTVSPEKMEWARDNFVLKAEQEHTFVRFEVTDTGVDLVPSDIPKLFEKFQDDDSRASRTGLGLALSRKFVQLMDGHIWIESNGPGKGATCKFIVKLKLDSEGEDGDRDDFDDDAPDVNFFALKIMVVDDNMVNRLVTKRLLDRIGISTRCVDSGKECLRILAEEDEEKYDVLLLDLMMPEMDGYTVATKIHTEIAPELRPMIVALTANADEKTEEQCLRHGMAGMITKPISLNALRDILGKMLDESARRN